MSTAILLTTPLDDLCLAKRSNKQTQTWGHEQLMMPMRWSGNRRLKSEGGGSHMSGFGLTEIGFGRISGTMSVWGKQQSELCVGPHFWTTPLL